MPNLALTALRVLPLAGALLLGAAGFAATDAPYHVETRWVIGGTGGWDYAAVDPATHHLYVTHESRVDVVDTSSGKTLGAITGLKRTHGVVFDQDGKYGYISDGGADAVVVFDRKTYATVKSIPTGQNPDGLLFEPFTKTVWAFNGRSKTVSVIDPAKGEAVATIDLPGKPEFPVADGKGQVFDNIEDKNSIVRLDARTRKLTATWPLTQCESPSGLAIDTARGRLFSVCDGDHMAVVDAGSGKQLATAKIGDGPDAAEYDPKHNLAFSSNGGDGTLSVVNAASPGYPTIETVPTKKSGRTMAFDPESDKIYVITADFGPRPAPTADNPRPRPSIVPGSFAVLVLSR